MKTKIIVEIETKNMKEFNANEDFTGEDITDDVEKKLHGAIEDYFKDFENNKSVVFDNFEESLFTDADDLQIKGIANLNDFGDVEIKVTVEKRT